MNSFFFICSLKVLILLRSRLDEIFWDRFVFWKNYRQKHSFTSESELQIAADRQLMNQILIFCELTKLIFLLITFNIIGEQYSTRKGYSNSHAALLDLIEKLKKALFFHSNLSKLFKNGRGSWILPHDQKKCCYQSYRGIIIHDGKADDVSCLIKFFFRASC